MLVMATSFFSRLSIGNKLNLGFGIVVGISFVLIGRNYLGSVLATQNITRTQQVRVPMALTSNQAQEELLKMSSQVRGYLVTGESGFRDQFHRSRQEFESDLLQMTELLEQDFSSISQQNLEQLQTIYQDWVLLPDQLFALRDDANANQPALRQFQDEGEIQIIGLQSKINELIELQVQRDPSQMNSDMLKNMADFQNSLALLTSSLRAYLITQDPSFRFEYAGYILENEAAWERLKASESQLTTNQRDILSSLDSQREILMTLPEPLFEIVESERQREDLFLFRTQSEPLIEEMLLLLDEVVSDQHRLLIDELAKGRNELYSSQWQMLLGGFFALGCAILLTFWLREKIAAPIVRLTLVTGRIIDGDFDARVTAETDDEVGLLARTFNRMTQSLKQFRQELETSNDELKQYSGELEGKNLQLGQALEELQQTQMQLIQTEKMSSLGQMVAGVAHEINNPVCFIEGNIPHVEEYAQDLVDLIDLYQKHYPDPNPEILRKIDDIDLNYLLKDLPETLASMQIGSDRISQIVLSLRNFSRLDESDMKTGDITEGIDNTLMLLTNRLKEQPNRSEIKIVKDYLCTTPIECYPGQLNQVFMNILSNGIDALKEKSDSLASLSEESEVWQPEIYIRTEQQQHAFFVTIADNGSGMPESVRRRLFDPFFTTKPVGQGTGLGLSISHQIVVEKHGGELCCESEVGKGTTFIIKIPIRL